MPRKGLDFCNLPYLRISYREEKKKKRTSTICSSFHVEEIKTNLINQCEDKKGKADEGLETQEWLHMAVACKKRKISR